MIDKVLKVNNNLVVIFYTDRPHISIATDDGTAMKLAMELLVDEARKEMKEAV